VTLPLVVAVFTALTVGLSAGSTQQVLHHHASNHARVVSYGGDPRALPQAPPGATHFLTHQEGLVCVTYLDTLDRGWFALAPIELSSKACALDPTPQDKENPDKESALQ
jgi:hypothetical protein